MKYLFVLRMVQSLSWVCNYPNIDGPVSTHYLYKEDNVNQVKWLDSNEYCRAKGDLSVYDNAGQAKCEYSRGICIWNNNNCIINPERMNDPYYECLDLLTNNVLVEGLDNGRIKSPTTDFVISNTVKNQIKMTCFIFLLFL